MFPLTRLLKFAPALMLVIVSCATPASAQLPAEIREILVPANQMGAVLRADTFGAVLARDEFDELVRAAREAQLDQPAATAAPVVSSATQSLRIEGERLHSEAVVRITSWRPRGEVELGVAGWNVLSVRLGDRPAAAARSGPSLDRLRVFLPAAGEHELRLQLSMPLRTAGSDRVADIGLLGGGSERIELDLPAGKFLQLDGLAIPAPGDSAAAAQYSLPVGGRGRVQLTITDQQQSARTDRLIFATTAYEVQVDPSAIAWTATAGLEVFGQPVDVLLCSIPDELEITAVESTGLENWELFDDAEDPARTSIRLIYRQAFEGQRTIAFRGVLAAAANEPWSVPALRIAEVTSHAAQVTISTPATLRLEPVEIAAARLSAAPPVATSGPNGRDAHRYETISDQFQLRFLARLKEQQVTAAMTSLLNLDETGVDLSLTVTWKTRQTPLFDARIRIPAEFLVTGALIDGTRAAFDIVPDIAGVNEIRVPFATPLPPGQTRTVSLVAQVEPEGWPVRDVPRQLPLPGVQLPQADHVEILYGISAGDELDVVPSQLAALEPAPKADLELLNQKLAATGRPARLAFSTQDTAFAGQLEVSRKPAQLASRMLTFYRIDRESLAVRFEARLSINGGGLRELTVQASESLGESLQFALVPAASGRLTARIMQQTAGPVADGLRTYTLTLDRSLHGDAILVTDAQLPRGAADTFRVPQLRLPQSGTSSGFVAIEAVPDMFLRITAVDAAGSPLPVVDPVDFPAGLYRPRQRVVAGYSHVLSDWTIDVAPTQLDRAPVPAAAVQRAELVSVLGRTGELQHQVTLWLTAYGAQSALVQLPAGARLWSTLVNDVPVESRQSAEGVLIPLTSLSSPGQRRLSISYNSPQPALGTRGTIAMTPPALSIITGDGQRQPLEILEQQWVVHTPPDVRLLDSNGRFHPASATVGDSWVGRLRGQLQWPDASDLSKSAWPVGIAAAVMLFVFLLTRTLRGSQSLGVVLTTMVLGILLIFAFIAILLPANSNVRQAANVRDSRSGEGDKGSGGFDFLESQRAAENRALEVVDEFRSPQQRFDPQRPFGSVDPTAPIYPGLTDDSRSLDFNAPSYAPYDAQNRALPPPASGAPISDVQSGTGIPGLAQSPFNAPQQVQSPPVQAAAAPSPGGLGLLSMRIPLQIPEDSRSHEFHYQGDADAAQAPQVSFEYVAGYQGDLLSWLVAAGVACVGWWLRNAGIRSRVLWMFLTVVLPLAGMWLAPLEWLPVVQGVLVGGLITLAIWMLPAIVRRLLDERRSWVPRPIAPPSSLTTSLLLCGLVLAAQRHVAAQDTPREEPRSPYVVIPYESLDDVPAGQRVWVPASLYRELWSAAHPDDAPRDDAGTPWTIAEAGYHAEVAGTGPSARVRLRARWVIDVRSDRQQAVPLPIDKVRIQEIEINSRPGSLTLNDKDRPVVLLPAGETSIIDAVAEVPAEVTGQVGSFPLTIDPVAAGTLAFQLPESSEPLRVRVNSSSDTFHQPADGPARVEIPIDRGGEFVISWQPRAQVRDAATLAQLESKLTIDGDETGLRQRHEYRLLVRQGEVGELAFVLPADLAVQRVEGPDVAGWELQPNGDARTLTIRFRRRLADHTSFAAEFFSRHALEQGTAAIALPDVRAQDVTRESGEVLLRVPAHLRLNVVEAQGLQQRNLSPEESSSTRGLPVAAAYRFANRPFVLRGELASRTGDLRVASEQGVFVESRRLRIASRFQLTVAQSPRDRATIALPPGYQPLGVVCDQAADWYVTSSQPPELIVAFDGPRTGAIEIQLEGVVPRPTDAPTLAIEPPRVSDAASSAGFLGVWLDDAWQAALDDSGDWRSIASDALPASIRGLHSRPVQFAFRSTGPGGPITFQTQRAVPELSGDVAVLIAAGNAAVDYGLTVRWKIERAVADRFSFAVPDWIGPLEITGEGIREIASRPLGDGRTRWTISLLEPARGQYLLSAAATVPLPADLILRAPQVTLEQQVQNGNADPLAAQQQFAVLVNLSEYQLTAVDAAQFEPLAAEDLPLALPPELVRQAMEVVRYRAGQSPQWRAQPVSGTVGSRAVVVSADLRTVLERDGSWRTAANYVVRNRGQQFLGLRLPEGARVLSVFVRGQPSRTVLSSLNEQPIHLVALPQTSAADLSFDVAVLLAGRLAASLEPAAPFSARTVDLPAPDVIAPRDSAEFGIPVAQTYWRVHVPDDLFARPVTSGTASNLVWHAADGQAVSRRQLLSRLKADIEEMGRIASDYNTSDARRKQSKDNLKQLEIIVQQQERGSELLRGVRVEESAGELAQQARDALQKAEEVERGRQQVPLDAIGKELGGNRRFIESNNMGVIAGNTIEGFGLREDASKSFNFAPSGLSSLTLRNSTDMRGPEAETRDELKMQLRSQLLPPSEIVPSTMEELRERVESISRDRRSGGFLSGPLGQIAQPPVPGQPAAAEEQAALPAAAEPVAWTGIGGLSVPMELPVRGRELVFSKVGGGPQLTLSVRPDSLWKTLVGFAWAVLVLAIGGRILFAPSRRSLLSRTVRVVTALTLLASLTGILFTSGGVRDVSFAAFCAAGLAQAVLWGRARSSDVYDGITKQDSIANTLPANAK